MTRILEYTISKKDTNITIHDFLKHQGFSRQIIINLKKQAHGIFVNGNREYVTYRLKPKDVLTLTLTEEASSEKIVPVNLPIDIIYEDEDILIINKQADMPIHPSLNNYENTLANAVCYYFAKQKEPFIFRCINRLDRDTTGLTIIAKNLFSSSILSEQMHRREIHREYFTIVQGLFEEKKGSILAPIGRKDGSTIERCVDFQKGEYALTHYEVITENSNENYSFVRLILKTGRTHQIRVHMKYIGHPLMGDFLYNPSAVNTISRQALHAGRLEFVHPITKENMCFEVPVPNDMQSLLSSCRH